VCQKKRLATWTYCLRRSGAPRGNNHPRVMMREDVMESPGSLGTTPPTGERKERAVPSVRGGKSSDPRVRQGKGSK